MSNNGQGESSDDDSNKSEADYAAEQLAASQQTKKDKKAPALDMSPDAVAARTAKQNADKAARDAAAAAAAQKAAYDAHFQYGGYAGGAADASQQYNLAAQGAQFRQAGGINYTQADEDRGDNQQARAGQMSIAQLLADRASGKTPSIAQMVGTQSTNRAVADQSSIAAGARGPAALALAQQQNAANSAGVISTINNQTQVNAAQERAAAEQAAFGAYSGVRGGDATMAGQDAQKAQVQSQIDLAQRQENDKYQLGLIGAQIDVNKAQLGAQGNQVGIESGAAQAAAARAQAGDEYDSSRLDKYIGYGVGGAALVGGALLTHALMGGAPGKQTSGETGIAGGAKSGTSSGDVSGYGSDFGSYGDNAGSSAGSSVSTGDPGASGGGGDGDGTGDPYSDVRLKRDFDNEGESMGALMRSDGAEKAGSTSRVDAFLDGIHPLSYHYKSSESEPRSTPTGGRYLGISAQDLEAVPEVGPQMVSEGPRGKRIESGPTLSAALAGLARLHERVKGLEEGGDTSPKARMSDAEAAALSKKADAAFGGGAAQREAQLSNGPAVGRDDLSRRADDVQNRLRVQQGAHLAAGPAVLDHVESFTSDIHAKTDIAPEGSFKPFRVTHDDGRTMMITRPGQDFDSPGADPRAAAWDQGHEATLDNVSRVAQMSPDELKASQRPEAAAVRGLKADAWDEGHTAGMASVIKAQHAAGGRSMDAAREGEAERLAAARQRLAETNESFANDKYNPAEWLRGLYRDDAPARAVRQPTSFTREQPTTGSEPLASYYKGDR